MLQSILNKQHYWTGCTQAMVCPPSQQADMPGAKALPFCSILADVRLWLALCLIVPIPTHKVTPADATLWSDSSRSETLPEYDLQPCMPSPTCHLAVAQVPVRSHSAASSTGATCTSAVVQHPQHHADFLPLVQQQHTCLPSPAMHSSPSSSSDDRSITTVPAPPTYGPDCGASTAGGQSVSSDFARAAYLRHGEPLRLQPAPPGRLHALSSLAPHTSDMQVHSSSPSSYYPQQHTAPSSANATTPRDNPDVEHGSADYATASTSGTPSYHQSRSLQDIQRYHHQHRPLASGSASATHVASAGDSPTASGSSTNKPPPREWPEEDLLSLVHVLNEVDGRSWTEIAKRAFMDDKYSASECQEKWREVSKERKNVNRGPWTREEDQALINAVNLLRPEKWVVIATQVGARNGKQCRERWHNHLSPSSGSYAFRLVGHPNVILELTQSTSTLPHPVKKSQFTPEEDETIFHWYSIVGSKWSEIAKHLPGRP